MATRSYDNSGRTAASAATRRRVLAAAYDLLVANGYAAMSMTSLADAARVSPQTIYNTVGSKAEVLKACYDVTLAGDDEPVPISNRPEFRRMFQTTTEVEFIDAYATWCRVVYDRVAPIIGAVLRGSGGDPSADAFLAIIDEERRTGTRGAMTELSKRHRLRRGLTVERAVAAVWTLNSPEVYDRLVRRCGWTAQEYERWLAGQLGAALIEH